LLRPDAKLLLSAANDGKLIAWGSSMLPTAVSKVIYIAMFYINIWNIRMVHRLLWEKES